MADGYQNTPTGFQMQQLTDEDIASDLLLGSKLAIECYGKAAIEATDEGLHHTFSHFGKQAETTQRRLWDFLHKKGWYSVHWATGEQVQKAKEIARDYESVLFGGPGSSFRGGTPSSPESYRRVGVGVGDHTTYGREPSYPESRSFSFNQNPSRYPESGFRGEYPQGTPFREGVEKPRY